jgi:agmatine deiminase
MGKDTDAAAERWRMPAEWEPHDATWLAWPHNKNDWPGKFAPIPWVFVEIIRHLHTGEYVHLLIPDAKLETRARGMLAKGGIDLARIRFFRIPTNRIWTRDYGPIFVRAADGRLGITHWLFNAWAKYDDWKLDALVPRKINRSLKLPSWQPTVNGRRVVLEGGSIDVDGAGLLVTTEECLLSPIQCRNPGLSRDAIEKTLCDHLGVRRVLWLGNGIAGDDTHGHVDDITRFVAPGHVVTAIEPNRADPNHAPLEENRRRLRAWNVEATPLPMPTPVYFAGQRLPASYANFYIGNDVVLVPTFNDIHDRRALGILQDLFPKRQVIGIHAVDLVWGLGTLHCMTQQQPRAAPPTGTD